MKRKIGSIKILDNTNFEGVLEVGENFSVENGKICLTIMSIGDKGIEIMPINISRIEKYQVLSYSEL